MHIKLRFVLVVDEALEDVEDCVKAEWRVDKMKAFLPCRRSLLTHERNLLDESRMELLEVGHRDSRAVQDADLAGNHVVVVFAHENVLDHVAYLYDFGERVKVGIVSARPD